jgi:basic membrane protein A
MKPFYRILVALIVASFVLAACGKATEVPMVTEVPTVAPVVTEAPTAAPVVEVTVEDCPKAEVICVGQVTDVGKVTDKSFNQSTWEALQQAKEDGLVQLVQYIETSDSKDYLKNMQTFGDGGFDIIVTTGFNAGEASIEAAKTYPDIIFFAVDQPAFLFTPAGETTPANFTGVAYQEDKSGFLVGALAAMMSQSHSIGGIAGCSFIPPVWRFGEGYKAGAAYADANFAALAGTTTEVNVVYHDDVGIEKCFTDPEWGKTTAASMLDKGTDVIFGIGGTTGNAGVVESTARGKFGIGVDKDQYFELIEAQPYMLSSAMKNMKLDVYNLIKMAVEGTAPGGTDYAGTNGYAPYHDTESIIPDDVKAMMETIYAGLLDGSILTNVPPVKPTE